MSEEDRSDRLARLRDMPFEDLRMGVAKDELEAQVVPSSAPTATGSMEETDSPSRAVYDPVPIDPAFSLRHPFTIDGVRYEALLFRPPAFEDVDAVMHGRLSELEMQARMASVPVAVMRALRWDDCEVATFIARRLSPDFHRN